MHLNLVVIFLFSFFLQFSDSQLNETYAVVNVCNGININANFIRGIDQVTVLKYSINLKVEVGSKRGTTKISLGNEISSSINDSLYYTLGGPQFWDDRDLNVMKCMSHFNICAFEILDGGGNLELPVTLEEEAGSPVILMDVMFDEGTIFQAPYGQLFEGDAKCFHQQNADTTIPDFIQDIHICCNSYKPIKIPSFNRDPCLEFTSKTKIIMEKDSIVELTANYYIEETTLQIKVTNFSAPEKTEFYLQPNENSVTCSFSNFNCTQPIFEKEDFEFDFEMFVQIPNKLRKTATVGKVSRRNGVFLKHDKPYTTKDPCWTSEIKGEWKSKFCCSKFASSVQNKCVEYESRTKISNDTTSLGFFQTRYLFADKHLHLEILNFTAFKDSNAMFHYFFNIFLTQDCSVTTLQPTKTCKLEKNLDRNYEFLLKTSFAQDGFVLFKAKENNKEFEEPNLNPKNPCITVEHTGLYPVPKMMAKTEVCCISTTDGTWPGKL